MKVIRVIMILCFVFVSTIPSLPGTPQDRSTFWSKEWEAKLNARQPMDRIMDSAGIKRGMVVAEVGAGSGRIAVLLAERVGESGKVYANDIDKDAIDFMRQRCEKENITNLIVIEGQETDPCLPQGQMDAIFLVSTYHCLEKPFSLLKSIVPALKPGAILVIIDPDKEKLEKQNMESWMAIPKETVLKTVQQAGFELIRSETYLPIDCFYIFRLKK